MKLTITRVHHEKRGHAGDCSTAHAWPSPQHQVPSGDPGMTPMPIDAHVHAHHPALPPWGSSPTSPPPSRVATRQEQPLLLRRWLLWRRAVCYAACCPTAQGGAAEPAPSPCGIRCCLVRLWAILSWIPASVRLSCACAVRCRGQVGGWGWGGWMDARGWVLVGWGDFERHLSTEGGYLTLDVGVGGGRVGQGGAGWGGVGWGGPAI
jgi:hypothetical protein